MSKLREELARMANFGRVFDCSNCDDGSAYSEDIPCRSCGAILTDMTDEVTMHIAVDALGELDAQEEALDAANARIAELVALVPGAFLDGHLNALSGLTTTDGWERSDTYAALNPKEPTP
jgi:5,10-methylenetetrahydrofolate reductase